MRRRAPLFLTRTPRYLTPDLEIATTRRRLGLFATNQEFGVVPRAATRMIGPHRASTHLEEWRVAVAGH